ncbi:hypothetical protein BDV10DRAFT_183060 [Aspergillus recurvatus]
MAQCSCQQGLRQKKLVRLVRGMFIGQAIADLLMSMYPNLEYLVLSLPFGDGNQFVKLDYLPLDDTAMVALPAASAHRRIPGPPILEQEVILAV